MRVEWKAALAYIIAALVYVYTRAHRGKPLYMHTHPFSLSLSLSREWTHLPFYRGERGETARGSRIKVVSLSRVSLRSSLLLFFFNRAECKESSRNAEPSCVYSSCTFIVWPWGLAFRNDAAFRFDLANFFVWVSRCEEVGWRVI